VKSLPAYSQSLLRIPVSALVVLAQKRQTLGRIVEFGPGEIIQFDKTCDEMLELHVGGRSIAVGEAVKVGDKFGLRVTSMVLPGERFEKVQPPSREADGALSNDSAESTAPCPSDSEETTDSCGDSTRVSSGQKRTTQVKRRAGGGQARPSRGGTPRSGRST